MVVDNRYLVIDRYFYFAGTFIIITDSRTCYKPNNQVINKPTKRWTWGFMVVGLVCHARSVTLGTTTKEPPPPWGKKKYYKYFLPCLNRAYKCTLPWENVLQGWFLFWNNFICHQCWVNVCSHPASQGVAISRASILSQNIHISYAERERGIKTMKWGEEFQFIISQTSDFKKVFFYFCSDHPQAL